MLSLYNSFNKIRWLLVCLVLCQGAVAQTSLFIGKDVIVGVGDDVPVWLYNTSLVNNGSLQWPDKNVLVWSGTQPVYISGNTVTQFGNMVLRREGAELTLKQDIKIKGLLIFQTGYIDLNGHSITLGDDPDGQVLNESDLGSIRGDSGFVRKTINLVAPGEVDPGHLGLTINAAQAPGITTIERYADRVKDQSIRRVYKVTAALNTNLNAAIKLNYLNSELAGIPEASLALFTSPDGKNFTVAGGVVNPVSHNLSYSGLGSLNWLTLAPSNAILPITLSGFRATCGQDGALLKWETQQELNSDYIEVQASANGNDWLSLKRIKTKGTAVVTKQYNYTDKAVGGKRYYRLKMVDLNGSYSYSLVISSSCSVNDVSIIAFPNPVTTHVQIIFNGIRKKQVEINLLNAAGQLLYSQSLGTVDGYRNVSFPVNHLAGGIYYVQVRAEGNLEKVIKIQKQSPL
jgi:hypothetical protein